MLKTFIGLPAHALGITSEIKGNFSFDVVKACHIGGIAFLWLKLTMDYEQDENKH